MKRARKGSLACPVAIGYRTNVVTYDPSGLDEQLSRAATSLAGLSLLVLFGSRARGQAHGQSDWDFGYLAEPSFDPFALHERLSILLATDDIDVVDLARASAVLRFRAAREGRLLYERSPGIHLEFIERASLFWCDVEPVIRNAHESVLKELGE